MSLSNMIDGRTWLDSEQVMVGLLFDLVKKVTGDSPLHAA